MNNSRVILGSILIIIGGLFVLDNFGIFFFDFRYLIFNWYTFFIIVGALIISSNRNSFGGWLMLGIGALGLAGKFFGFSPGYFIRDFWPLVLIGIGLYIILNRKSKPAAFNCSEDSAPSSKNGFEQNSDYIDEFSMFYSSRKVIYSDNFKGGKITSIFGGTNLDLTNAKLAEGYQVIDSVSLFGGLNLYVRQDVKIDLKVTSIFGGFSDKRIKSPTVVPDQSRTLVIKGLALFGGGSIKNYA